MEMTYDQVFSELKQGIASLPNGEGTVLQLYYVESMTWREICFAMKLPYEDVRALYWIAINKLKSSLEFLHGDA